MKRFANLLLTIIILISASGVSVSAASMTGFRSYGEYAGGTETNSAQASGASLADASAPVFSMDWEGHTYSLYHYLWMMT